MTILEELQRDAHPKSGIPPRELLIRDDQLDQLVSELNQLQICQLNGTPQLTSDDVRMHGCRICGISVRVVTPH
jgi:hypothetical protein